MVSIILKESISGLGVAGDVVDVKNGFARNFLFPYEKAVRATKDNLAVLDEEREKLRAKDAEALEGAKKVAELL